MLTQLFEEIAAVIEKYYSVVLDLYGREWTSFLIERLQVQRLCADSSMWYNLVCVPVGGM